MATSGARGRPSPLSPPPPPQLLEGTDGRDEFSRLQTFLRDADIYDFFNEIYFRLGIRRVNDLADMTEEDAEQIGMTRPQFTRLKRYLKKEKSIFRHFRSKTKTMPTPLAQAQPSARFLIARENVTIGHLLGTGEYGEVYQGEWKDENGSTVSVAVKSLHKDAEPRYTAEIQKEIDAMSSANHPNILRLYGVILSSPIKLVLELAPLGSLEDLLVNEGPKFPVLRLYKYAQKIASGMEYLAEKNIVHRDLASRNVLLVNKEKPKISDFGLARPIAPGRRYYEMTNPKGRVAFGWTAPEALKTLRFTVQSDVWSYGVFLWEMFSHGSIPWGEYNAMQIYKMVDSPLMMRLPKTEHCVDDVYCLMNKCWAHDPDNRPTFTALRKLIVDIWPHKGKAITDLHVENDLGKMSFSAGDVITITEMAAGQLWWFGQNAEGKYGRFPEDHVKILPDREMDEKSPPPLSHELSPQPKTTTGSISRPLRVTHDLHIGHNDLSTIPVEQLAQAFQGKTSLQLRQQRGFSESPPKSNPPPLPHKQRRDTQPAASYHTMGGGGAPPLPPPKTTFAQSASSYAFDQPPPYYPSARHDPNSGYAQQSARPSSVSSFSRPHGHPYGKPPRAPSDMPEPPPGPGMAFSQSAPLPATELSAGESSYATLADAPRPTPPVEEELYEQMSGMQLQQQQQQQRRSFHKTPSPEVVQRRPLPQPPPPSSSSLFESAEYVSMSLGGDSKAKDESPFVRSSSASVVDRENFLGGVRAKSSPKEIRRRSSTSVGSSTSSSSSLPDRLIRQVQGAVPETTEGDVQRILTLYDWQAEEAILHLSIVREAGFEASYEPKRVQKTIKDQGRDPEKSMKALAIAKVLDFVREAKIDSKIKRKDAQRALEHCNWRYDRAINFFADKKATKTKTK